MIKKEMIENFGMNRKTLNNWENDPSNARHLLYRTLEALPLEFVENIKKQMEDKKENETLLKSE
jgi:hypothetical protein